MSEKPGETLHCYKHPDRETLLRCNKCGRPICQDCAVQTPVGYRCKECIAEQQKVFETATGVDIILGCVSSMALSFAASYIEQRIPLGGILPAVICGLVFGTVIAAIVSKVCRQHRSKELSILVCACAGFGGLLARLSSIKYDMVPSIVFVAVLCGTIWSEMNSLFLKW